MNEVGVYKALGDPIRMEIIKRLTDRSPQSLSQVTDGLGISRQGARKQLQVLVSAKLIRLKHCGRETHAHVEIEQLRNAREFIFGLEKKWDQHLVALKTFAESSVNARIRTTLPSVSGE